MPLVTSPTTLTDPTRVGSKRVIAASIDLGIEALVLALLFLVLAEDYERYSPASGTYIQGRELQGAGAIAVYAFAGLRLLPRSAGLASAASPLGCPRCCRWRRGAGDSGRWRRQPFE